MVQKIAIVTIQYPPTIGGLQAHVKGIADLALSLGYDVSVITSEPNPTMKIEGSVDDTVTQLPVVAWFKDCPIINPFVLYKSLKNYNPDIIHLVYPFPFALEIACLYGVLNKKKILCTYIDDIIASFPYSIFIKIYENTLWKLSKRFISSISVSSLEYGKNANGLRDWKKRFYIIPPPIFETNFELNLKDKYSARKKLGLEGYDKVALFVGGLRKRLVYKRPDLLLKAWSKLIKRSEGNPVLLIIGDGELADHYKNMAQELGLSRDNTRFMGYVKRRTLEDCYLAGDVCVLPSEDNNEAFGITPVEAMLYGNAVVASDIPGIRGAIKREDDTCVSLVPLGDSDKLLDEILYWFSKKTTDYAIKNHEYVKKIFKRDNMMKELGGFIND